MDLCLHQLVDLVSVESVDPLHRILAVVLAVVVAIAYGIELADEKFRSLIFDLNFNFVNLARFYIEHSYLINEPNRSYPNDNTSIAEDH